MALEKPHAGETARVTNPNGTTATVAPWQTLAAKEVKGKGLTSFPAAEEVLQLLGYDMPPSKHQSPSSNCEIA